ncbi:Glutamine--fructose-6-phosphate aminotransferase [isomerizing] [Paraburkholderia aspalathi]|uniref:Glutamine--fructose-6-phosphate aminotransferase [isomerizing] n=1 Tax=Paraburkholderia aspalathi TaxID=1324617 RepID=A0ABM8R854_9BURK|nr:MULTISPECIES: glutamine--fructose-6-phosphate transaminase (isomerizing) [Paraburkholderia]MBK3818932.1 glutamine--fructose-6-phosphate transaminase (isomerizing) [Paraburkholderia aspalathi]MBK3830800.1 glutamine--fructose-6-phosphate transaminase (isomerizing) [Paraburkholderia aspalathi]MBK3860487.1 glutamine--fructose-6-phosphate transaminase (isomerizing) [Paraburkholderia aspalathi]MCX4138487.1 glutamine--fructose-6-phosphate transaminase (isomerizing) [Paraburkholderia aspalathi]MDN7
MCGIVGAVAQRNILPDLVNGLKRLEYRGYDSCGVALYQDRELVRARSVDRVATLQQEISDRGLSGYTGIAHTRWATHGKPVTTNAHPHFSPNAESPRIALSHNGIIENYEELRETLRDHGYVFSSQTDSEVIAHLIDYLYDGDLFDAVRETVARLRGSYAIAVICRDEPHRLVGARDGMPLVIGIGEGENFLASDAIALSGVTDKIAYLENGDVVDVQLHRHWIVDAAGRRIERPVHTVAAHSGAADLGLYRYYMQKEIFEQPRAVADTLQDVSSIMPELFGDNAWRVLNSVDSVVLLACGGSFHAALTAKYWIESLAQLPVNVEIASEYRYRESVANPNMLVVAVSQSGETADVLGAIQVAKQRGMLKTLAICNVPTSALVRECALNFITRAGIEIGVASTKAFTTQLVALFMLALTLAQVRGRLSEDDERTHLRALRHLPDAMGKVLALEPHIMAWSEILTRKENILFLGRGMHYPVALEGALKMKEISYIHAEGYAAGELKHGPLALISDQMPVVAVAPNDRLLEKLKSNMHEVNARNGKLFVFADIDCGLSPSPDIEVIRLTEYYGLLSPILHTIPMQLLAFHTALARGTDIDKPRNLAKSVTVE